MTAADYFRSKTTLPTELRTREMSRLPLWMKEQSFFMAGVMDETVLSGFREAAQAVLDGRLSEAEATRLMRDALKKADYRAGDGQEGTIKDLTTLRRQMVTLNTNVALMRGWGTEAKQWAAREAYPAKELYRAGAAKMPRPWQTRLWPAAVAQRNAAHPDLPPLNPEVMMALLGDPVWPLLSDFGTPYDPLKYGSKMRQRAVRRKAWRAVSSTVAPASSRSDEAARVDERGQDARATVGGGALRSPGENLEIKLPLNPATRDRLTVRLGGLAEWQGDTLIFTDPNGTRPYTPAALAPLLIPPNVDGTDNYQLAALREWQRLGGDENALAEMRRIHAGTDMLDDFNRLLSRMQRARKGIAALELLLSLVRAMGGAL